MSPFSWSSENFYGLKEDSTSRSGSADWGPDEVMWDNTGRIRRLPPTPPNSPSIVLLNDPPPPANEDVLVHARALLDLQHGVPEADLSPLNNEELVHRVTDLTVKLVACNVAFSMSVESKNRSLYWTRLALAVMVWVCMCLVAAFIYTVGVF